MTTVVKIGTAALTTEDGLLNREIIFGLAYEIARLEERTKNKYIVVTSGAVGTGRAAMARRTTVSANQIVEKQGLAFVGQPLLIAIYATAFAQYGRLCGQMLVTRSNFSSQEQSREVREKIFWGFDNGVVPVINENDVLSSEELQNAFTDNDRLARLIMELMDADRLIVLSDVDGFLDGSPNDPNSKVIPIIRDIDEHLKLIDPNAGNGRGGMRSKLETAKAVTARGATMFIANGKVTGTLTMIESGERVGTEFPAK